MDYCRMFYEPMLRPLASNTYDHSRPLRCPLISFILQLQHELYVISSLILYLPPEPVCTLSNVGGFPSWCKGFTASWHDRATVWSFDRVGATLSLRITYFLAQTVSSGYLLLTKLGPSQRETVPNSLWLPFTFLCLASSWLLSRPPQHPPPPPPSLPLPLIFLTRLIPGWHPLC